MQEGKTMFVIYAEGIKKKFGNFYALNGVNLTVNKGDIFGLFGQNGAGKTTLLKILTAQISPNEGNAFVLNICPWEDPIELRRKIGIVPESESPASFLTTKEFLYFIGRIRGVEKLEEKVEHWIKFFDLKEKENTLCKDLSKGMRQKIMLASAFIHSPELLFLDEPFINLDPLVQKKIKELLLQFQKEGKTIFLCSHILEIAEKLCNRFAIIDNGEIIAQNSIEELKRSKDEHLEEIFHRLVGSD